MKKSLFATLAVISSASIAQPQTSAAPPPPQTSPAPAEASPVQPAAPASTAPAAAAALNGDTPIETLMSRPDTKAILLKYVPEIENHPAYDQFKSMSLRQLQPLAGGLITDEKIAAMEADLKKLK